MNGMTQKELLQLDAMADRLRQKIRTAPDRLTIGKTVYYVAADGCDDNDGRSPATPWRTLEKVSAAPLVPGDGVTAALLKENGIRVVGEKGIAEFLKESTTNEEL